MMSETPITPAIVGFFRGLFFGRSGDSLGATQMENTFLGLLAFSAFWFVLLMGLMVYFVVKYRRRAGVAMRPSPAHNNKLEVFWTVVPSMALIPMFLYGFWGYMTRMVPAEDAIELRVTARKWSWEITYPNGAQSTWTMPLDAPELEGAPKGKDFPVFVVPADSDITFKMLSEDVIHSFWIPDQRVKMDVYPNRFTGYSIHTPALTENDIVLHPETGELMPGRDMIVFCAEYCGAMHSEMAATLRVVPEGDYHDILNDVFKGDKTPLEVGQIVFKGKCVACHSVDGSRKTGPSWLDVYGSERPLVGGGSVVMDENYIRESLLNPGAKVVESYPNAMTSFDGQMSEEEIFGVIAYFKQLAGLLEEPADEPATEETTDSQTETEPAASDAGGDEHDGGMEP